ncbi:MAG TPA: porin family protein [Flavitalea sp.]|nr:porin family protein [Flavitalea sp.]
MRKLPFLVIACLSLSISWAQEKFTASKLGLKVGVNYFNQHVESGRQKVKTDYKPQVVFGFFNLIDLGTNWQFQPEFLLENMGSKDDSFSTRNTYLTIPLLLKYSSKSIGIYAGPQAGLLLSGKITSDFFPEQNVKDAYKSIDLAGIIGTDYTFSKRWMLSARYHIPFNNILKDAGPGNSIKNKGFQLTIGVVF